MYVAKFSRNGVKWTVTIFEKRWNNEMLSNETREIGRKNFFLHRSGYKWINKEISRVLFEQHELEIING